MGKYVKTKIGMNKTVIKDGYIVRLRKDGSIASRLEPYVRKSGGGVKQGNNA
jgi:hypothetical protein